MINKTLGNWQIERLLAKGGMGEVYLARHSRLGTLAAAKVLPPLLSSDSGLRQRFFQEAQTQAHLRHLHIAQIVDFIEDGGSLFQLIEYLPGGTLAELQQRSGNPPLPLVVTWTSQVLSALAYAHDCGVIHRDIKPSNILLDQHGDVKLTDFGIALVLGDKRLTSTGKFLGTPEYMSPEQITTPKTIDARSDIYSMGIVLFELLTGKVPFTGETDFAICQSQVNDKVPDIPLFNSSVPPLLAEIIKEALNKSPTDRYQSCKDFLCALERFEQTQPFRGIRETRVARDPSGQFARARSLGNVSKGIAQHRRLWTKPRLLLAAAVLLVGVGLACLVYMWPRAIVQSIRRAESQPNPNTAQKEEMSPEHLLATLTDEESHSLRKTLFSPAGNSVAYELKLANKRYVVVNGVRGPAFDQVGISDEHAFSEDGSKFAYCGKEGTQYVIMVNNQITGEFHIDPSSALFHADLGWFPPQFSPHGETLLYVAPKGGKLGAIAGDWEGPLYDFIKRAQFSANGTTIAYIAVQTNKDHVAVGDWKEPDFDTINEFSINRNGSKVAYVASEPIPGGKVKQFVVSGDWRSRVYISNWPHDAGVSGLQLSADGDELMYSIQKGKKRSLVLHGRFNADYEGVRFGILSPDGNSYAFEVEQDGKYRVVLEKISDWEPISPGEPQQLLRKPLQPNVESDTSGPTFDLILLEAFSPDSSRLAYLAKRGNKISLVCSDSRGPECDLVFPGSVRFSSDSAMIGYGARIGNELWWKTLDLR